VHLRLLDYGAWCEAGLSAERCRRRVALWHVVEPCPVCGESLPFVWHLRKHAGESPEAGDAFREILRLAEYIVSVNRENGALFCGDCFRQLPPAHSVDDSAVLHLFTWHADYAEVREFTSRLPRKTMFATLCEELGTITPPELTYAHNAGLEDPRTIFYLAKAAYAGAKKYRDGVSVSEQSLRESARALWERIGWLVEPDVTTRAAAGKIIGGAIRLGFFVAARATKNYLVLVPWWERWWV